MGLKNRSEWDMNGDWTRSFGAGSAVSRTCGEHAFEDPYPSPEASRISILFPRQELRPWNPHLNCGSETNSVMQSAPARASRPPTTPPTAPVPTAAIYGLELPLNMTASPNGKIDHRQPR
jgi:hypothetical protein